MGRDKEYPLTPELEANLDILWKRLNEFRQAYGKSLVVSSGFRPGKYNSKAGGAKNSAHLSCQAVDFRDGDGKIKEWVLANQQILEQCDLYMEDPTKTITWIHLQSRPTNNRIFKI